MNNEIFEGIKLALARGDSMQRAMYSFYNAGYAKNEIEEAAKAVQLEQFQKQYNQSSVVQSSPAVNVKTTVVQQTKSTVISQQPTQNIQKENKDLQNRLAQIRPSQVQQAQTQTKPILQEKPIQKVSDYDFKKQNVTTGLDILIILLIIAIVFIIGGLITSLIYKSAIVNFLNTKFG
ncbi:MAG: hypothetical protein Q7S56_00710 [Nanoarchaeota archaeon]|nr:hypothetical protein [Nanoarchaeota archaeon]